jgi:hypothetical protein
MIKNEENELTEIMKSTNSYLYNTHNYPIYYFPVFKGMRTHELQIMYIGDWSKDENTYMGWKQFFPNSNVYFLSHIILENVYSDNNVYDVIFVKDIHINVELLVNLHHNMIKENGIIIIENIGIFKVDYYQTLIDEWRKIFSNFSFRLFHIPNVTNTVDNRICIIHRLPPQLYGAIEYSILETEMVT